MEFAPTPTENATAAGAALTTAAEFAVGAGPMLTEAEAGSGRTRWAAAGVGSKLRVGGTFADAGGTTAALDTGDDFDRDDVVTAALDAGVDFEAVRDRPGACEAADGDAGPAEAEGRPGELPDSPASAWAMAVPPASAAPTPKVNAPAPNQA